MNHKIFLSHFSGDKEVAEIIAGLLNKISLRQIDCWFSSDSSAESGLKPGHIWFNEIIDKINLSKAVVVILTPNSISRPWIYFESGIAQAKADCEVIPICVGVDRDSLKAPLNLYQCYQTTDYKSLREILSKLLFHFQITFDEEMAKPFLEKSIAELAKVQFNDLPNPKLDNSTSDAVNELKSHLDNRFVELMDKLTISRQQLENFDDTPILNIPSDIPLFSIRIVLDFPDFQAEKFLDIRESDTFQDVANSIFYMLDGRVSSLSYLVEWVMYEYETKKYFVIKEVASLVPAKYLFKPSLRYIVEKLEAPFDLIISMKRVARLNGEIYN